MTIGKDDFFIFFCNNFILDFSKKIRQKFLTIIFFLCVEIKLLCLLSIFCLIDISKGSVSDIWSQNSMLSLRLSNGKSFLENFR